MRLEFFIPGQARPAGSKSAYKNKKTSQIIVTHANPATKQWMDSVRFFALKAAQRMVPTTEAVCLKLIFLKDRPKGHFGSGRNTGMIRSSAPAHFTTVPDLTKLTRAVEDGLTGIVWKDDSQVIAQETLKRYCRADEKPGVQIIIETVNGLKGFYDGKENEIRGQTTGHLFGRVGREGGNDGGD
ncbi:MAG: RusA family crossover junction endodeoxyribonuclease [Sedimentisphaerales bacterium]|nr:RusA family crossover junction endodeoxyribonuclease [Sedimentisphaerales bacterium]